MPKEEIIGMTVKKDENFSEWYTEVVQKAELADYAPIAGCIIFRPYSYEIWEYVQDYINKDIKARGHKNAYFPLFIPESFFKKEAEHAEGFAPEVAWIAQSEDEKGQERYALRPTSEAIMMDSYSKWVRSHRDLPILINQWCNVVRWETAVTKPFLRTREFLWQEGHTAHKDKQEAEQELKDSHEMYRKLVEEEMAIPVLNGVKSKGETFAGAQYTRALEALMPDGRAVQMCTSHYFGNNFAKAFDIKFLNEKEQSEFAHTTSWGMSTRVIGAIIMVHGDDKGLILPPRMAPIQAVIVPIVFDKEKEKILKKASELKESLKNIRVQLDDRDTYKPGWKFHHWELKGVPVRIEIGPKDLEKKQVVLVRRDTGEKIFVKETELNKKLPELLETIQKDLYKKAAKFMKESIRDAKDFKEFSKIIEKQRGFVKMNWCGELKCEQEIKDKTTATVRIIAEKEKAAGKCPHCGKEAKHVAYFAKSY
ncbi:MAG: proline--tRNA ligase [archaeon]